MPKKLYLETFGCQMNVLDSELVLGQLRARGFTHAATSDEADVILYNTCSVREHAEQKVWSRLGRLRDRKQQQPGVVIGVIGCMAERDGENLFKNFPHVDLLCGPAELDKLPGMVMNAVTAGAVEMDAAEAKASATATAEIARAATAGSTTGTAGATAETPTLDAATAEAAAAATAEATAEATRGKASSSIGSGPAGGDAAADASDGGTLAAGPSDHPYPAASPMAHASMIDPVDSVDPVDLTVAESAGVQTRGHAGGAGRVGAGGSRAEGGRASVVGGVSPGGKSPGGISPGGVSTGGVTTGSVTTAGVSTGGISTRGVSPGGVSTGGVLAEDRLRQVALMGSTSRRSSTLAAAQDTLELLDLSRAVSPGEAAAQSYVRITRGCNKFCTYCVVPYTRGAEVHRPPGNIVDEVKKLVDAGSIEVTLLGQTINHYAYAHGDGRTTTFADLLYLIHESVPGLPRLRFVTSFPRDFTDQALAAMRDCERVCRYLHVPAQHGSNRILKLMNRGYTIEQYRDFVDRAREMMPDISLASDFIVGFPSETEAEFEACLDVVRYAEFKNSFIFKYSPRPGTTAIGRLNDDVPEAVKRRRNNRLLDVQGQVTAAANRRLIGQTLEVMVEGVSKREARQAKRSPGVELGPGFGRGDSAAGGRADDERTGDGGGGGNATGRDGSGAGAGGRAGSGEALTGGGGAAGGGGGRFDLSEWADADLNDASRGPASESARAAASARAAVQLVGRTRGDQIVVFNGPESLAGTLLDVEITSAEQMTLFARRAVTAVGV